jgi:hypothetical protein
VLLKNTGKPADLIWSEVFPPWLKSWHSVYMSAGNFCIRVTEDVLFLVQWWMSMPLQSLVVYVPQGLTLKTLHSLHTVYLCVSCDSHNMRVQQLFPYTAFLSTLCSLRHMGRILIHNGGPGSSVGIVTGHGLDGPGIESRWRRDCPHRPDRSWGPPSLLYNEYRVFLGGRKWPGRDADPSTPPSAEV